MYKPIISREESQKLECAVRELIGRSCSAEAADSLYSYVRRHTEILFYLIPKSYLYLKDEDCAEFLLSQKDHIDTIIYSYRIVRGCSYLSYIRHCVRMRSMVFTRRKIEKERLDLTVSWSCMHENPVTYRAGSFRESEALTSWKESDENIKDVFRGIIEHPPARSPEPIKRFLTSSTNRRNMLIYIISEQDDLSISEQQELARLFNTPEHMMASLSFCMHAHHDTRRDAAVMKREQGISRNWVRYLAITEALKKEDRPEKRLQLELQQQKSLKRLRGLQAARSRQKRGMSYRDISANLEISVGTVVHGIRSVRNFLLSLTGDKEKA